MRGATALFGLAAVVGAIAPAAAETVFIDGQMRTQVVVEVNQQYDPAPGTNWISRDSFRVPSFTSPTWRQRVVSDDVVYSIKPTSVTQRADAHGNQMVVERWESPTVPIRITRKTVVEMEASLSPVGSQAAFPLPSLPADAAAYLKATPMVQADDPRIRALAQRLTAGVRTERQAVSTILGHVVDTLTYKLEPPAHDALGSLTGTIANCQGFSHLSIALLRAVGIPARLAVGITLSKGWRVRVPDGTREFKWGKGRHAWIEVYYPDLGWIPYDPQGQHLFVSLYHVRHAVGLDVKEVTGYIRAVPALPSGMHEVIDGDGLNESYTVYTVGQSAAPRNYVISPAVRDVVLAPVVPPPPPPPPPPPAVVRRQDLTRLVEFGNTDFPASLRIFATQPSRTGVAEASPNFIVETADYATGPEQFAQAFRADEPLLLTDISLALQKFGGQRGDIWLELFDDRGGKPGARVAVSRRVPVSGLFDRGGYRWVVFTMAPADGGIVIMPGRYWFVLNSAGDGIFNWFFSLGKAGGDPNDSRSRPAGGGDWSNVLSSYRFNYRITGLVKP